jgi:hypothetical protein
MLHEALLFEWHSKPIYGTFFERGGGSILKNKFTIPARAPELIVKFDVNDRKCNIRGCTDHFKNIFFSVQSCRYSVLNKIHQKGF